MCFKAKTGELQANYFISVSQVIFKNQKDRTVILGQIYIQVAQYLTASNRTTIRWEYHLYMRPQGEHHLYAIALRPSDSTTITP